MGFYGNVIYNTYGLQEKSVLPKHLDRSYWRQHRDVGINSFQELREKILRLPKVSDTEIGKKEWIRAWEEAEKGIFVFHFSNQVLRTFFGSGLIVGWVLKETDNDANASTSYFKGQQYALHMMAFGDYGDKPHRGREQRPGSIFKCLINPIAYDSFTIPSNNNNTDNCESKWNNKFLTGPKISDFHLLKDSVVTEKIKNNAVITDKIKDEAVTRAKIENHAINSGRIDTGAVLKTKLSHNYWESIYYTRQLNKSELFELGNSVNGTELISDIGYDGNPVHSEDKAHRTMLYCGIKDTISGLTIDEKYCLVFIWKTSSTRYDAYILSLVSNTGWIVTKNGNNYSAERILIENDDIADDTIAPEKFDRPYMEKCHMESASNWNEIFNSINVYSDNVTSDNKKSSLLFVDEINDACIPSKYTDGHLEAVKLSNCVCWKPNSNILYVQSLSRGQVWYVGLTSTTENANINISTDQVKFTIDKTTYVYTVQLKETSNVMLANNSITTEKILPGAVTGGDGGTIACETITSYNIAPGSISGGDGGHINKETITSYNIAFDTITGDNIKSTTIQSYHISYHAVTGGQAGQIAQNTITSYNLSDEAKDYIHTIQYFEDSITDVAGLRASSPYIIVAPGEKTAIYDDLNTTLISQTPREIRLDFNSLDLGQTATIFLYAPLGSSFLNVNNKKIMWILTNENITQLIGKNEGISSIKNSYIYSIKATALKDYILCEVNRILSYLTEDHITIRYGYKVFSPGAQEPHYTAYIKSFSEDGESFEETVNYSEAYTETIIKGNTYVLPTALQNFNNNDSYLNMGPRPSPYPLYDDTDVFVYYQSRS